MHFNCNDTDDTKLAIENQLNCFLLSFFNKFIFLNQRRKENLQRSNFLNAKFSFHICMLDSYSAIQLNISRIIICKYWCDPTENLLPFVENWNKNDDERRSFQHCKKAKIEVIACLKQLIFLFVNFSKYRNTCSTQ